ncbi:MAG: ATP synthase subunit I [Acidobacteriota bacterium]
MNYQPDPYEEKILRRVPGEIGALAFFLAIPAWIIFDLTTAGLFFLGGIVAATGFLSLKNSLTRFLLARKTPAVRSSLLLYGVRLLLIIAIFFFIILFYQEKIIAFAAGFSTIVIVFFFEAGRALIKMR